MRLRRYEAWVLIDDGDGEPLAIPKARCFTRKGAESYLNYVLGSVGLNFFLLNGFVRHGVDIQVTGEVRERT